MKIMHVHATSTIDIKPVLSKINISGKIGLLANVQFLSKLGEASKILKNSIIVGQVLGCDASKTKKILNDVDAFLFIGSEHFHAPRILLETGKPVYIANPLTNNFYKIDEQELIDMKKRIKGRLLKFLNAKTVGIWVSTKPGQYNMREAVKLKNKIDKKSYLFISNTLKQEEFENFMDIDCWVNTACNRIEGRNIINIGDVLDYYDNN